MKPSISMSRRAFAQAISVAALLGTTGFASNALAQDWPSRPITLIVPFSAGGPTDTQFRALGAAASQELGQPIVVINQPGVSGTLAPATMARSAAPDGYTLSLITPALFRLPHLQQVPYDALKDFTYIIGLTSYVYGVSVAADSRWKTFQELIAYARANPGKVNVAGVGTGSLGQITTKRLAEKTGVEFNYVPFKGGADATLALLGGHVDVMIEAGWGSMAEAGKLRLLAVAEAERITRWNEVPTLRELGYDIVVESRVGLGGPKGIDPKVVGRLHEAFHKASTSPGFQRALAVESMPYRYLATPEYQSYAVTQFENDKLNIRSLGLQM